jgi:hypothetical protein
MLSKSTSRNMLPIMEIVLPQMSSNVPAFLGKLWKMVDDPDTNYLISWSDEGNSFIIHNQVTLLKVARGGGSEPGIFSVFVYSRSDSGPRNRAPRKHISAVNTNHDFFRAKPIRQLGFILILSIKVQSKVSCVKISEVKIASVCKPLSCPNIDPLTNRVARF